MPNEQPQQQQQAPRSGQEQGEERSIGSMISQFASNVDTGAGLTAGGLAVKGLVDGAKSIVTGKSDQQKKE